MSTHARREKIFFFQMDGPNNIAMAILNGHMYGVQVQYIQYK